MMEKEEICRSRRRKRSGKGGGGKEEKMGQVGGKIQEEFRQRREIGSR